MTDDPSTGSVVLFGGKGAGSQYFNDLWTYTPKTDTWSEVTPVGERPPARFGHAIVYDADTKELIVFGGVVASTNGPSDDLWAYSMARSSWVHLQPSGRRPEARVYTSMVYDPSRHETFLFGGWTGTTAFSDTWMYNSHTTRWAKASGTHAPHARWGAAIAYDSATGTIVLFGGLFGSYDGSHRLNDTWSYNPTTNTWRKLHPVGPVPPARGYAAMDYNRRTNKIVLFGGFAGPQGLLSDSWSYDPTDNTWSRLRQASAHPSRRDFSSLVYDQKVHKLVLFGGLTGTRGNVNGTLLNDSWSR